MDHGDGLVVRGYISKIDRSVQPYGLVVPASYSPTAPHRWRLDAWFHGRNETLSEVNFLADREKKCGRMVAARHHRAAPLRTLLQRQPVRRRGGFLRSAGRGEAPIPDRREPHSRSRLQHGRRVGVGYGHASRGHVRGRAAGRRIQRDHRISEAQTHRATPLRRGGSRSCSIFTTPPGTR